MSYSLGTIKLSVGGLSLTLSKFTETSYPREEIETPKLNFSTRGTPALSARLYEPKHIWNLSFVATEAEQSIIRTMWRYYVGTAPAPEITIDDYHNPIEEAARTRLFADEITTGETLAAPSGWVRYYARFLGLFTQPPSFSKNGKDVICTVQLTETSKAV